MIVAVTGAEKTRRREGRPSPFLFPQKLQSGAPFDKEMHEKHALVK